MAGTLATLMWKHFTVRKRRYIYTSSELVNPIIIFVCLFILWECLGPEPKFSQLPVTNVGYKNSYPVSTSKGVGMTPMIMYTPDNEFTRTLMDTAGGKLHLPRLDNFSGVLNIGYYGFTNNSELLDFLAHIEINEAIIIFEDNGEKNPRKLEYTIRLKEDFITHVFETPDTGYYPQLKYAQIYSPFMELQWAIDSSFIELKSGKRLNMAVYTQKFPYDDLYDMASMICMTLQVVCSIALIIPFVFMVTRLMEERTTGLLERMKMVGVSSNVLSLSHLLNAAPTGLVFSVGGALLLTVSSVPIVNSSTLLIMIMLALYYHTVVAAAFVCSFISTSSDYPKWLSLLHYASLWLPVHLTMTIDDIPMIRTLNLLNGLLPHTPMYWFWTEVFTLEQYGKKVDFSTMWSSHSERTGSVFLCYVLMVLQCCLMAVLVAYLSLVRVSAHGVALPWNFFLQKQYWCKKVKSDNLSKAAEEEPIARDPKYFEPPPRADVVIGINNVSKVFGKEQALNNVSFDVYKGEITVLIGHNGAGKTTLMSIITGMISATEGKVVLNGRDASEVQSAGRNEIGICPHHNPFFPDLTVTEHVMFFSLLKGVPFTEARKSSQQLLDKLGIAYKDNSATNDLSRGMKKRLHLACALAGGSSILVLDEPTYCLDEETRRGLWGLLLMLRGEHTVLLATHCMEEVYVLGNRVAALHAGQLRCHATPMHLKKNIGTGYRLSLTTTNIPNEPAITSVVTAQVSDATFNGKGLNSISYSLPASSIDRFPQLFTMLEAMRSELGVDYIGVGVSTLEEVFLRSFTDINTELDEDTDDVLTEEHVKLAGFTLCIHQMVVLMKRQFRYTMSRFISFLICQVAIPIIIIFLAMSFAFNGNNQQNVPVKQSNGLVSMDLDLYKNMPDRRVLYNLVNESYLRKVRDHHPEVDFEMTSDVADAVLRKGKTDLQDYSKYLAGIEVNDTSSKILYARKVRHTASVALNLLSNVLAARVGLDVDIITYNQPVTSSYVPEITRVAKPNI